MQCYRCSDKYHHSCLNFNKQDFNGFSKEYKDSWVCPACRCKEPKLSDNSNTPIRSSATSRESEEAAQLQPAVAAFEYSYDNVTLRTRPRCSGACSCISADNIRDIIREELNRKLDSQFDDMQLKLISFQDSLAAFHMQSEKSNRDIDLQREVTVQLQNELRTIYDNLTKRVQLLEQSSRTCDNPEEQPVMSQLPALVISDWESASATQRKTRRMPRKRENDLPCPTPKETNTDGGAGSASLVAPAVAVAASSTDHASSQPILSNRTAPIISPERQNQPTKWTEVLRRKPARQSMSLRCLAGPAVTSLRAVEPRQYMHLWNMLSSADEVKQYLMELFPQKACTVEELKTKNNYRSYKIGVPEECFDRCFSVEVWPENARVKKWVNYRKRGSDSQSFQREVGE